ADFLRRRHELFVRHSAFVVLRPQGPAQNRVDFFGGVPASHGPNVCYFRPMREPYDELSEIKREIIESRGPVIKTNNLTNAPAADLKSIAKRQQSYERRL